MLLDTTTFVDLTRDYRPAVEAFRKVLYGQSASIINKFELIVGSKSKKEMNTIGNRLEKLEIAFFPITADICEIAEEIMRSFYHSHGVGIEDALIAATALVYDEELATHDTKHFDFIPNLKLLTPY